VCYRVQALSKVSRQHLLMQRFLFKNFFRFRNLAKSIREKATDMALGLVQPRTSDIQVRAADVTSSPRHVRRQRTISLTRIPDDASSNGVKISLDIVLNTPVLIVPRSSSSPQVLVAHLGKISITNTKSIDNCELLNETLTTINEDNLHLSFNAQDYASAENILFEMDDIDETVKGSVFGDDDDDDPSCEIYTIDIRNMNLYSLDTTSRKGFRLTALPRAEEFYSCQEDAAAIIHDTAIRLEICRKNDPSSFNLESSAGSFVSIADMSDDKSNQLIVSGSIVNPLRLSLKRPQYEQLLDTVENAFNVPNDLQRPPTEGSKFSMLNETTPEVDEMDNFTFDNNEKIKKILHSQSSLERKRDADMLPKVMFSLPAFIIQLNNAENSPVVEICFRDFNVNYEKQNQWETNLQVSLRSVIMEDLLRPIDSKHRIMVTSANEEQHRMQKPFLSTSCPDLTSINRGVGVLSTSLPDNLDQNVGFKQFIKRQSLTRKMLNIVTNCPGTPPPSPQQIRSREDNLVIYSSVLIDPQCPLFESKYKSKRARSSIDFNCLSLNISVESWFVLLNFFGLLSDDDSAPNKTSNISAQTESEQIALGKSELDITIKSLSLVLVKPQYELARASVSNARFIVTKSGAAKTIEGSLGVISVTDLTSHGSIYREKFMTSGNEAINFVYVRENPKSTFSSGKRSLKKDAELNIKMSSVRYVHTKR
jgi:vacuolar protein sorting-associated protein 13D